MSSMSASGDLVNSENVNTFAFFKQLVFVESFNFLLIRNLIVYQGRNRHPFWVPSKATKVGTFADPPTGVMVQRGSRPVRPSPSKIGGHAL